MVVADETLADPAERGSLHVRDQVVARIARLAALEVEGVTEHSSGLDRVTGGSLPKVDASTAGGRVRASVDIATVWPASLAETSGRVRDHVRDQLARLSGLDVDTVDVSVAAIVPEHTGTTARRRVQ